MLQNILQDIRLDGWRLWMWLWTFGFLKVLVISWLAAHNVLWYTVKLEICVWQHCHYLYVQNVTHGVLYKVYGTQIQILMVG